MTDPRPEVSEAQAIVLAAVRPLAPIELPLEQAHGLVLCVAPVAPTDVPPRANAAMDGYAVRATDVAGASPAQPVRLPVATTAAAGGGDTPPLAPGTAVRIYTGATVPTGADSVIRQEHTDLGSTTVTIRSDRDVHHNVRPAGGDVRAGSAPVPAGARLTPARLGVLASLGVELVEVIPPPRIGILATGDELAAPDEIDLVRRGERLGNSNAVSLAAAVRAAGGVPLLLGPARDTPESLDAHLAPHLDALDALITTGGVSVGDRDLVRPALAALGATEAFHRVRLRPGGPTVFGQLPSGAPWFGLPGNPVSTLVTFHLFVRPAIRRMLGWTPELPAMVAVELAEAVSADPLLEQWVRVTLSTRADTPPRAHLTGPQGSQLLTSIAAADALVRIPPGEDARVGARLEGILLE